MDDRAPPLSPEMMERVRRIEVRVYECNRDIYHNLTDEQIREIWAAFNGAEFP